MAFRSTFPARSPRGKRRQTAWSIGPQSNGQSVSSIVPVLWTNGSTLVAEAEVTIVRIRGLVSLKLTGTDTAGGGFFGALGIGLASTPAFTAGQASLPTPISEVDWPGWIWHQFFSVSSNTATIADGVNAVGATQNIVIDTKAMRKQGQEMVMFGVIEGSREGGTATVIMDADCRMLNKLT